MKGLMSVGNERIKNLTRLQYIFCVLFPLHHCWAQFSIGTWRDHLPYSNCIDVVESEEFIYTATEHSIFKLDRSTNEIEKWSKANKLSDVGTSSIDYDPITKILVVGYSNGNIDLFEGEKKFGVPDLKLSTIVGDKRIYNITIRNSSAYVSCGLGVVVVDLISKIVKETYFIGQQGAPAKVTDVAFYQNKIYAVVGNRILFGDASNQFLSNYLNWNEFNPPPSLYEFEHLEFYDNHMIVSSSGVSVPDTVWTKSMSSILDPWGTLGFNLPWKVNSIWSNQNWLTISSGYGVAFTNSSIPVLYFDDKVRENFLNANYCIFDSYNSYWVADKNHGLARCLDFTESRDSWILPMGPSFFKVRKVNAYNDNVWLSSGGVAADNNSNLWNFEGVSGFVDNQWSNLEGDTNFYNASGFNSLSQYYCDPMEVAISPINNKIIYIASWEEGLLRVNTNDNSLQTLKGSTGSEFLSDSWMTDDFIGCAAVTVDNNDIVWAAFSKCKYGIAAYKPDGTYALFDTRNYLGIESNIFTIYAASNGFIYAIVLGKGVLVLNTNGTLDDLSDDNLRLLSETESEGNLPSSYVYSIIEDLDGEIWMGTEAGLAIIYNSEEIFAGGAFSVEQILIEQDGNTQILLETEQINAIEIDGSNKKWIATMRSGLYQLSPDGIILVNHFTAENSPLFSNTVYDLAINQKTGEVYAATDGGLVGYFSTATNFDEEMGNVRVFPNPVRPNYSGNITIDGLAFESSVKITDLSGALVYETKSEGGRAVWNGLNSEGNRPATGVYTIFVTNKEGRVDDVRKLTFIH